MEWLINLVILGLVIWGGWLICQPRYLFVVRISQGKPRLVKGKATAAFLQQVNETCSQAGLKSGWVGGVRRGKHVALVFSRSFPQACRQQLRNIWVIQR